MLLYFIPIVCSFIISFDKRIANAYGIRYIYFICTCLFFTCGYMTGDDWVNYEFAYNTKNEFEESGYNLIADLFKYIGFSYTFFRITCKIILFCLTWNFIRKFNVNFYFLIMMFVSTYALYLYINDTARNLFAYVIFLYSTLYYFEKKYTKMFVLLLSGMLFHLSIILVIPLLFLNNIKVKSSILIMIFIFFNLLFISNIFIVSFLKNYSTYIPIVGDKISVYINLLDSLPNLNELQGRLFSIGLLIRYFCFWMLIKYRNDILKLKYGHIIFSYTFVYLILYRLGVSVVVIQRISYYFFIFYLISFASYVFFIKRIILYKVTMFFISLLVCFKTITESYRYIPYTNVITYILKGKLLPYAEREDYNILKTPYKK